MNAELAALFAEDQADRRGPLPPSDLVTRDALRRGRVRELAQSGALVAAEDFFHAAMICQHGAELDDYWQAHEWAKRAADLGFARGRWLAAAAYDRWLINQGKPQKFGTQYRSVGDRYELYVVDPATTDEERAAWGVPSLEAARQRAEEITRRHPPQAYPQPKELARLDVPGLTMVVLARAPLLSGEPEVQIPSPIDPERDPVPASLPPGLVPHRLGHGFAGLDGAGRPVLHWFRTHVPPGDSVWLGHDEELPMPRLEEVATPAGPGALVTQDGGGTALWLRAPSGTVWCVAASPGYEAHLPVIAASLARHPG